VACLLGCSGGGSGSLELTLNLPSQPDLRPVGMTTITVTATEPGGSPVANTSVIVDNAFSAGEFPVGTDVQIGVVLRDVSNRIVGVGEAGQTVDIVGDAATQLSIPVRRPFVYASSGSSLFSFDPTLDPRDPSFQGKVGGVTNPLLTVSVGGDRLAVISSGQVQIVVTATNAVMGSVTIPGSVNDAVAVPGTHKLVVAHGAGMSIVDVDAGTVTTVASIAIDRVTAGPGPDGSMYAYGLAARVAPPERPNGMASCSGSSSIIALPITASGEVPAGATTLTTTVAISDLAAAPGQAMLFAALPCAGKVVSVSGIDTGTVTVTDVAILERAAALTVAGDRIWAAGTKTSTPQCTPPGCLPTTTAVCPHSSTGNRLQWVNEGARVIVQSIPLTGGTPITLTLPARRETIVDVDDTARQHAQVLKSLGVVPLDLVALPGGQYVGIVTRSRYYIEEAGAILPCLDVTTGDWMLIDMASSSVAQRVRTSCVKMMGPSSVFQSWACEEAPDGERLAPATSEYLPISVGALFGAR
jgi:hypothetical protein